MKRYVFLFIGLILMPISCFATNTNIRTQDNPLVPKDVIVNKNNINDIINTPAVSSEEKLYDFASLITDSEKNKIVNKIEQFKKTTGMESIVVITDNLNGFSLSNYAYNFYDYNDFANDGVILVVYIDQVEPRIFMGNLGNAVTTYTDQRIKQILSYIYNDIKVGNYYSAISDYEKIINGFYVHDNNKDGEYKINKDGKFYLSIPWAELIVLSLSLTFIIMFFLLKLMKKKEKKLDSDFLKRSLDSSTLIVKIVSDEKIGEDFTA